MQLLHLEMTAIGPFAGTEAIDFAALGRTGLFLLEGPTGSGKTTIIDAITFALYNKVAASSADIERIHSHHADPRTVPTVTLLFQTQSGLYRVRRTPRYEAPKSRGTGTTTKNPTVKLWRLSSPDDPVGELLSSSLGDVEDEITRAIGLTRDQFVQTVILPQGEFATFLRARSEDKAILLEKVFGTDFFRRVQDEIIERGRRAEAERTQAQLDIRESVQAFAVASGVPDEEHDDLTDLVFADPDAFEARLDEIVADVAAASARAQKEARSATEQHSTIEKEVHEARLRKERRDRLHELQALDAALKERRTQVEAMRAEHRLGVQAAPVFGAFRTLAQAEQEVRATAQAVRTRRGLLSSELHGLDAAELRTAAADRRRLVGSLQAAVAIEERLAARTRLRRDREAERVELGRQHEDARTRLARLPAAVAAARAALAAGEQAHALLDSAQSALTSATSVLTAVTALARHTAALTELEAAAGSALGRLRDAEAGLALLRRQRIDGIAGELGLTLRAGAPCPVCGSTEHPLPAAPAAGAVTAEQVAEAEATVLTLRESAEAAGEGLAAARVEQARLTAAGQDHDLASATSAHAAATEQVRAATLAGDQLPGLRDELAQLERSGLAVDQLAASLAQRLATTVQSLTDLDVALAEDERAVTEARGGHDSVSAHISAVELQASRIDGCTEALAAATSAARAQADAQEALDDDLAAAQFDSQEQWFAARRSAEQLQSLATQIAEYDTDVTTVRAGLESKELSDLAIDALFADVDALVALVAQTKKKMAEANALEGSLKRQLAQANARRLGLDQARQRHAAVLAETTDAVRVGRLVAGHGDNQLKMDLVKYVLIRRFTQVLGVANTELARFSGGRYSMEHTDAKQGNARSGLGVRIHDMHTNQVREVGTLSGGETFYVSLALALALAEVVRAESGGVDLGTLFVDEGFGTLDPDVLDDVMQTLESLREGGRTVGIVSHVSELKARVSDRIEVLVQADRTSTLRVTT